ncbi:MAG TPA: amidohydrolase family protein [Candidatus Xenobia bacterium]|jgi:predicted TIM-barrel fold metal-dependent hydrolase
MIDGCRFVDCDMHVSEPIDLFDKYLDPAYRHRITVPRKKAFGGGHSMVDRVLIDGRPMSRDIPRDFKLFFPRAASPSAQATKELVHRYKFAVDRDWDAESQVMAMDMEGIDIAVLFPSTGLYLLQPDMEPHFALAVCQAYNNWMHEYTNHCPEQMKWIAMLPYHDVNLACRELERCVKLGARGSFLRPNPVGDVAFQGECRHTHKYWGCIYWMGLYELQEELGVPLCFHEGTGIWGSPIEARFGEEFIPRHIASHWVEAQLAMIAMMTAGIFEHFPSFKVAYLEAGAAWVPGLLSRIESNYRLFHARHNSAHLSMTPKEYFQRQCWVSTEGEDPELGDVIGRLGPEHIAISSDYPHYDSEFPNASRELLEHVPKEHATKILRSAADLYGFTDEDFAKADAAHARRKPAVAAGTASA